jgi:hypothetical protein
MEAIMSVLSQHPKWPIYLLVLAILATLMTIVVSRRVQADLYLAEDFEGYPPGQKPLDWREQDSSLSNGDFFQTITWNGDKTYGISLAGDSSYYSHYDGDGALTWQNYEVRGRLYYSHRNSGVGVTFYSRVSNGQDRYYRLGHYPGQLGFRLVPHGTDISDGTTSVDIETQPDTWYRFRIRVETLGGRVTIRAKVWIEGDPEPGDWPVDCYDSYTSRITAGTVGLWTTEAGFKALDDLMVFALDHTPPPMPPPTPPPSFPRVAPPAWPIGLFDIPLADHSVLQSTGFDTVHQFNSTQTISQAITYLNSAEATGLQVIQNMPSASLYESDEFWIAWVQTLSDYNALVWWYLPEEPTDYGATKRLYRIVREHDPQQRPAITYFPTTALSGWCDAVDGILIGSFPEWYKEPHANVMARVNLAQEACLGWPVIATPMFFDSHFDGTGEYPSPVEARFDAYTAIVAGARGLHWYSYYRGVGLTDLWSELQEISLELSSLKGVLTSPPVFQTIQPQILSGPTQSPESEGKVYDSIQTWQAAYLDDTYLFASNLATGTVIAQFNSLIDQTEEVQVLFEERSLSVVDESIQDTFEPNEVHIYYLPSFSAAPERPVYLPLIVRNANP